MKSGVSDGNDFTPFVPEGVPDPFDIIDKGKSVKLIPTEYVMQDAYPNPFNPTTTIRFGLPVSSNVVLNIYNLSGQKVTQLVNSYCEAGFYDISWNATDLSSGIYFCRIQAGEFHSVRKIVLVK